MLRFGFLRTNAAVLLLGFFAAFLPLPAFAQQSFSDIPEGHPIYTAAEFLKEAGVIQGYEDGTYKPEQLVNRAEAVKMLVAPLLTEEQLATAKQANSSFTDVPSDSWFHPYVELSKLAGVIDGPPKKTEFLPTNTVIKVELFKIMMLAHGIDPNSFSEIKLPLAQDVTNPEEWYYPYMRYAMTSSVTMISPEAKLDPSKQLTRGDVALYLFRFLMYQQNRRTQALLSEAETEMQILLAMLDEENITEAKYASARGLLAARGAHASRPDEPIVKGAVKVTEAFRALVNAFEAGTDKRYEDTVKYSGDAWNLATKGREFAPDLKNLTEQIQTISKQMADEARSYMEGSQE